MNEEGKRMKHGKALLLALATAAMTACATAGGAGPEEATGNRPQETDATRQASVHLVQAGLAEGEEARASYQEALDQALLATQETPQNPKAYLIAGQAAVGLHNWVQADTMFAQALDLWPQYQDQITAEREQAWAIAYNLGADALSEGDLDRAIAMFQGADQLYQGRPEARIALGSVYLNQGNLEAAAESYARSLEILNSPPPAALDEEQQAAWVQQRQVTTFNAAELLAQTGNFDRAVELLQGYLDAYSEELDDETRLRARIALAGFLARAGQGEEAEALYESILTRPGLSADDYFQVGIGFFNTGDYDRAAEAFASAAELNPYSRDALLNLVQSLYSRTLELEEMEATPERDDQLRDLYDRIIENAEEVRELDPLNRNLLTFMLRSYRAKADLSEEGEAQELTRRIQELFRVFQEQPYEVSDIQLAITDESQAQISGTLTNLGGEAGERVQLRFEVLNDQGAVIDTVTIDVTAPEQNAMTQFSGTVNVPGGEFAGWQYQLVE